MKIILQMNAYFRCQKRKYKMAEMKMTSAFLFFLPSFKLFFFSFLFVSFVSFIRLNFCLNSELLESKLKSKASYFFF